jgi:PHS family inorganic phosphate transporter-like MFS transporter
MIASVFLMQPIGQTLAQVVNIGVLIGRDKASGLQAMRCGLDAKYDYQCRQLVDGIWRIVIGVGAFPALLAILFRFTLPDSGLYNLEVRMKSKYALSSAAKVYGRPTAGFAGPIPLRPVPTPVQPERDQSVQFSRADMHQYFIVERNWLYLFGTASTWFFLDVALYGFGLDNRTVLADLWATTGKVEINSSLSCWNTTLPGGESVVPKWRAGLPVWQTDVTQPCQTIYDVLLQQAKQYLLTVSIGSILGCLAFVFAVNLIPRRQFLTWSFISLAILFGITGGVYYAVHHGPHAVATTVMVGICHFAFNFGMSRLPSFPDLAHANCHLRMKCLADFAP